MKRKYYATGKIAYLDFLLPYWWGGYTTHDIEITPISYIYIFFFLSRWCLHYSLAWSILRGNEIYLPHRSHVMAWDPTILSPVGFYGPGDPPWGRLLRRPVRDLDGLGRGHVVPMEMWPEDWEVSAGLERAVGASLSGRDTYWSAPVPRRSSRNEPNG